MHQMTSDSGITPGSHLLRLRWQIPIGLLFAVLLPLFVRSIVSGVPLASPNLVNTATGGSIAMILGYVGYRRLQVFPSLAAGGFLLPSFSIPFGLLAVVLILFRMDYSSLQLLASFVISLGFYALMHVLFVARRIRVFGVVPGGDTERLPYMPRIIWHRLTTPGENMPHLSGVIADLRHDHNNAWDSRIAQYVLEGVPVYHVKQAIEQLSGRVEVDHLSENTLGSLNPNDNYIKAKAVVDGIIAMGILIIAAPVMISVAIAIRLDSSGPALFKQQRTGFRAKPFTVFKFRTMRTETSNPANAEAARLSAMTQENDPRITQLGSFLRKTRLDELPQLINILKGEMSLIGPRPEVVALTRWYEKEIPFYHYRHIIKPGVTGWAQVNQGHVAHVDEVREKLHLDFYYVKNFSFWLDLLIAMRTVQTMITGHGSR